MYNQDKYQQVPQYAPPQYSSEVPPPYDAAAPTWRADETNSLRNGLAKDTKWRDPVFAALFLLHILGTIAILVVGINNYAYADADKPADCPLCISHIDWKAISKIMLVFTGTAGVCGIFATFYLWLCKRYPRQLIWFTILTSSAMSIGFGIYLCFLSAIAGVIVTAMGVLMLIMYLTCWRRRVPFASAVLVTVTRYLNHFPATYAVSFFGVIMMFAWVVLWSITATFALQIQSTPFVNYLIYVYLILSFYWTTQVIKNIVHVTVCGLVAACYFMGGADLSSTPHNPTLSAFRRATTSSLGSICLGSLLVALLETLRTLLRGMRNERNGWLVCLIDCMLGCIENLIAYFNVYAFTQVAIYGKTYCQAARDTWSLVAAHGVKAIINDNIISTVLSMGCLLGAVLSGLVGGLLSYTVHETLDDYTMLCAIFGLFIGFVIMSAALEVVGSAVAALFVCFAMDPEQMRRSDPQLFDLFFTTYALF